MAGLLMDDSGMFTSDLAFSDVQSLHEAVPLVRRAPPKAGMRRPHVSDAILRAYRQPLTWLRQQLGGS